MHHLFRLNDLPKTSCPIFQKCLTTFRCTFLLMCLLICANTHAQTAKAHERAGNKAMDNKEYYAASQHYKNSVKVRPKANVIYKFAQASRLFGAYEDADKSYAIVAKSKEKNRFTQLAYWQGVIKKHLGQYDEAQGFFRLYTIQDSEADSFYRQKAEQEIRACKTAKTLRDTPLDVQVDWVEGGVNTPFSEFAPHRVGDSLFYSSMRFKIPNKKGRERYRSNLLLSTGKDEDKSFEDFSNSSEHLANSAISPNGERLYFTKCEGGGTQDIICQIYVRKSTSDGSWQPAQKLPETVNISGFTATHPNVGYDSLRQKEILFFSSNRSGGQGKMDVWYSEILPTGGYGDAVNLGAAVNSIDDEITPFFHIASQSLYFSSNWHEGLGGHDIFNTRLENDNWTPPINAGYPLNSSFNDVYFVINADNSTGYLSSNRTGSLSLNNDEACCNDIYAVTLALGEGELPFETDIPTVETPNTIPTDAPSITFITSPEMKIEVPDETPPTYTPPVVISRTPYVPTSTTTFTEKNIIQELEELLPVTCFFDNDQPNPRSLATTTTKNYEETYLSYFDKKETYKKEYAQNEQQLEWLVEDFFDWEIRKGYQNLDVFAMTLLRALNKGYTVKVSIKGYTSPRASAYYNNILAKRRIHCVRNYFGIFQNNILQNYINSGQLIFYETPFGETTAPKNISDALNDRRNSIYSLEASRERRVEIVEIERVY